MFHHPDWAVISCSSCRPAGGTPQILGQQNLVLDLQGHAVEYVDPAVEVLSILLSKSDLRNVGSLNEQQLAFR